MIGDYSSTQRGSDIVGSSATFTYGAFGEVQSVVTANLLNGQGQPTTQLTYHYARPGGAAQSQTIFLPDITAPGTQQVSNFAYQSVGGQDQLQAVSITDGRPRTVTFQTDIAGEVIRRDEQDGDFGAGDPHELWYRFGGRTMGYLGNNRSLETDHTTSLIMRTETPGAGGAFRNGQTSGGAVADFDQGLAPLNSYGQGSARGSYTVRAGDTLAGIAAGLWGDASLWWKLAEANGLSAGAALMDGQRLSIPAGVIKNTYNASTFAPYDPAAATGDVSPTNPVQPKPGGGNGCGVIGQIILVIIAVVVTIYAPEFAAPFWEGVFGAGTAATVATGATAAAAGSIVSQGVGVATGIQEKFSWNAVAMAAVGGAVGGGLGAEFPGGGIAGAAARGAAGSAITQGIGVATGLQRNFDWAGVAAAGVGAGFAEAAFSGGKLAGLAKGSSEYVARFAQRATASAIGNAATRSLINGTDFGDNLMAALPDVIGQTIGEAIAGEVRFRNQTWSEAKAVAARALGIPVDRVSDADVRRYVGDFRSIQRHDDVQALKRLQSNFVSDAAAARGLSGAQHDLAARLLAGQHLDADALMGGGPISAAGGAVSAGKIIIEGALQDETAAAALGFHVADELVLQTGSLIQGYGHKLDALVDSVPGFGLAIEAVNIGMIIAGGPFKGALSIAKSIGGDAIDEAVIEAVGSQFQSAGYDDDAALTGATGVQGAIELLTGVKDFVQAAPQLAKLAESAKLHLNRNDATSEFGVYEIEVNGVLHKVGKADLSRPYVKEQPNRVNSQIRPLIRKYGRENVEAKVTQPLGVVTTKEAKAAETARLQDIYDRTGAIPEGNRRSFKPKPK